MTEDELKAIEARILRGRPARALIVGEHYGDAYDVTPLLLEVRRLRGLIKAVEFGAVDDCGVWCPWCHHDAHDATCPAFTESGDVR